MPESPLRVLVVLPLYGGSLPIGRWCERALKRLGHVVDTFEAPDFYDAYTAFRGLGVGADRLEYLENSFLQVVSQAVLAKVEAMQPDLVLAMAQAPLSRQALKRLRKDGVSTAMWFVEDFRLFTYWQAYAQYYDLFAVIQKEPFFEQLAAVGQQNVLYLPLAADPEFHRPLELGSVERAKWGAAVSFMGAGYPNRRVAFKKLLGYDFKIWGNEWDGDPELAPYNQLGGARVSPEDCVKIFNATAVNINLHSSIRAEELVSRGDFVNPRTYELAMCGAFQLVDERGLLSESFAANEMPTFGSIDELVVKIEHFLVHAEERKAYADRARARALAEHTYDARMESLVAFARERLPGWPRPRKGEEALEVLPERYREEATALLAELNLPASVPLEDLVAAVRAKQGVLSDLETAILFLDEWRKQYAS